MAGWVVGAVLALLLLPPLTTRSGGISDITSTGNPAIVAESRAAQAFGFPVLSRTMLVQHDPAGLPQPVVEKAYQAAKSLQQGGPQGGIVAALPVLNAAGIVPGSTQTGTTLVTYLYPQATAFGDATRSARTYAATHFDKAADRVVGVTGTVPARYEQTVLVNGALPWLEVVSVLAVVVIVGVAFRSVVAPLLTITTAGISYVLVTRLAGVVGDRLGVVIPPDLEPLMVALMVGVTTDYVVYFLSGLRGELMDGHGRVVAARRSVATFAPIVAAAGFTVAAGVASLLVASTPAVRTFAPAMARRRRDRAGGGPDLRAGRDGHPRGARVLAEAAAVRRAAVRSASPSGAAWSGWCGSARSPSCSPSPASGASTWLALPVRHIAVGLPLVQALPLRQRGGPRGRCRRPPASRPASSARRWSSSRARTSGRGPTRCSRSRICSSGRLTSPASWGRRRTPRSPRQAGRPVELFVAAPVRRPSTS